MAQRHEFPFKIRHYSDEFNRRVAKDYGAGFPKGFVKTNHWGFNLLNGVTEEMLSKFYNQPVEEGDIWVVTLPKCGTTWTQEMVWLIANDCDFEGAQTSLEQRWHFLEFAALHDADRVRHVMAAAEELAEGELPLTAEQLLTVDSRHRRFVKSHLPLSLNPSDLLQKAKVVYVARNPKDMLLSYYNHLKLLQLQGFESDLATLFDYFIAGETLETPFFPHVLEAWNLRQHPNLCFVFFEDMKRDLRGQIRRVAEFLGKQLTEEQLTHLEKHLSFESFKNNPYVNREELRQIPGVMAEGRSFINKGLTGGWKQSFTPEMCVRMDAWIQENLQGTDLRFQDQLEE